MRFLVQGYPAYAYTGGRPYEPRAPALVMVHGAAFDHGAWQWQSRHFAHHGFTVLAVDLPGHGRSPGVPRRTIEAMADWVAALLEAAGLPRAAIAGHSMGSLVALETAVRHRAKVDRLVLVGTAAPMAVGDAFLAAAADDSPAALDMEATWGLARDSLLRSSPIPGTSLQGASRALNARAAPGLLHTDLEACRRWAPPMEAIGRLDVPTLVVCGRRDQMTPPGAGQALAAAIPGARQVLLDAGHTMMSEAPRELLAAMKRFLASAG